MYKNGPRRRALSSSVASMISVRSASRDGSNFTVGGGTARANEKSPPGWPLVPSARIFVLLSMREASSEIDFSDAMVTYLWY